MKHTSGPWDHDRGMLGNGRAYSTVFSADERTIAEIYPLPDEGQANAHLISAAPEMYEALNLIIQEFDANTTGLAMARTAIAKAEGRTA